MEPQPLFRCSDGDLYLKHRRALILDGMTYSELQKECTARGLAAKGKKEDLKARLTGQEGQGDEKSRLHVTSCPESLLFPCTLPESPPMVPSAALPSQSVRPLKGNRQQNSGIHNTTNGGTVPDRSSKVGEHPTAAAHHLAGQASCSEDLQPFRDRIAALKRRKPARQQGPRARRKQTVSSLPHSRCGRLPNQINWIWTSLLVAVFVLIIVGPLLSPGIQQCLQIRNLGLMHLPSCIRIQLQQAMHDLLIGNQAAGICPMDGLFRSGTVRNFVPHVWLDSLEDAEEFAASTTRTKGVGVLLICDTEDTCKEGVQALRSTATSASQDCRGCFECMKASAMKEGADLPGQLQLQLTALLKKCPTAVYVVEGAAQLPYSAAKVLVNALSEHGHFQDSGAEVPSNKATYIFTVAGNDTDDATTPEQFTKTAMDWLSATWMLKEASGGEPNVRRETALALRRRIDFSLPLRTPQRHRAVEDEA